jgi:hypothetical protein
MGSRLGTMTHAMNQDGDQRDPEVGGGRSLAVRELAWAALLGRWIEFAKASVALPADGDGPAWKRSTAPFIELQAIVWALRELAELPVADRPAARDRAEVQVRRASAALDAIWRGVPMPSTILELLDDATIGLREALYAGLTELLWTGPGLYVVPAVDVGEPRGTLALMPPGSLAMPGEPVAWFTERDPVVLNGCIARAAERPRQVYRQLDDRGHFIRDVVAPLEGDIPPGLPMLVAISLDGTPIGRFPFEPEEWQRMQRVALGESVLIPVEELNAT